MMMDFDDTNLNKDGSTEDKTGYEKELTRDSADSPAARAWKRKKGTLSRSPPQIFSSPSANLPWEGEDAVNNSVVDFEWDEEAVKSVKKAKRAEERKTKQPRADHFAAKDGKEPSADSEKMLHDRFIGTMKKMERQVKDLQVLIRENKNTKVEIKETTERLGSLMSLCMTAEMRSIWERRPKDTIMHDLTRETASSATQTEQSQTRAREHARDNLADKLKKAGENGYPLGALRDLLDERWPKEAFRVKEGVSTIAELGNNWDVAALVTADFQLQHGTIMELRDRYRGIEELRAQNLEVGGVTQLTDSVRFQSKEGRRVVHSRNVYYGAISLTHTDAPNLGDVLDALKALKIAIRSDERKSVAITDGGKIDPATFKKMVEYVFHDATELEVKLLLEKHPAKPGGYTRDRAPRQREDAVILKVEEGKTYAGLLRQIKENVDIQGTGVKISSVRKTRAGDILVAVKKKEGADAPEVLKRAIAAGVPGTRADILREKMLTLYVSGLDGATEKVEVEEAIRAALPGHPNVHMTVADPWPTFRGGANTAITLPRRAATDLARMGSIPIGWMTCSIREKIEVKNCYKCRGYGHLAAACQNEETHDRCRKCLQPGHQSRDCKNEPACVDCKKTGHRGGTTRCPIFSRLLAEERTRRSHNYD